MELTWIIKYYWIWGIYREKIEMQGVFTLTRWKEFCKKPHPYRSDVEIIEISRSVIDEINKEY